MPKANEPSKPYDLSDFPRFEVTVDIVLLSVVDRILHVLLIQRADETERSKWALPGGFKKPNETLDAAAARELMEETNVRAPGHLAQFRAYGDPGRDPRGNVVTVAYLAAVRPLEDVLGGSDARKAAVLPVADVIGGRRRLAFDHRHIVKDAVEHVADQLDRSDISLAFLPPTFTMSDIRTVHEAITGQRLDPANFRRRLLALEHPIVEPTGERGISGTEGGRPAELFRRSIRG